MMHKDVVREWRQRVEAAERQRDEARDIVETLERMSNTRIAVLSDSLKAAQASAARMREALNEANKHFVRIQLALCDPTRPRQSIGELAEYGISSTLAALADAPAPNWITKTFQPLPEDEARLLSAAILAQAEKVVGLELEAALLAAPCQVNGCHYGALQDELKRDREAAQARIAALEGALSYLFDTEGGPDGRPRVLDACYTAFQIAKSPNKEDGAASDWFTDTRPAILKIIGKMKEDACAPAREGE